MTRRTVLVAAAVLVFAGCGSGPQDVTVEASPEFLAASAERTVDAGTGRMEMTIGVAGQSIAGVGAYDVDRELVQISLDVSSLAGLGGDDLPAEMAGAFDEPIEIIAAGTTVYMRFPLLATMVGADADWVKFDASEIAADSGNALTGASNGFDPAAVLDFLQGVADDVTEVGTEDVRGEATTHLQGSFTIGDALEQLPEGDRADLQDYIDEASLAGALDEPTAIDVFVDGDGLVRRIETSLTNPEDGTSVSVQCDYFDFGAAVDIEVPEDAFDLTALLGSFLPAGNEIGG